MQHPSTSTQEEVILFMEMENYIKQDLESPENYINTSGFPFKDQLVSFLPEEIHRDAQGNSSHTSLHTFLLRMQPTKSTIQRHHSAAYSQPGFYLNPQTTRPITYKE
jgi:hypothetical protein